MDTNDKLTWIKSMVPAQARRITLVYLAQKIATTELRNQVKTAGVSDMVLSVLDAAEPMLVQHLLSLLE